MIETTESKDFIHLVTMPNHVPYSFIYDDLNYETLGAEAQMKAMVIYKA